MVSLQAVLASREREMEDLRSRIEELQRTAARRTGAGARLEEDDPEAAHAAGLRVRELEGKVAVLEQRHRLISEEKEQLTVQLEAAKAEVRRLRERTHGRLKSLSSFKAKIRFSHGVSVDQRCLWYRHSCYFQNL